MIGYMVYRDILRMHGMGMVEVFKVVSRGFAVLSLY